MLEGCNVGRLGWFGAKFRQIVVCRDAVLCVTRVQLNPIFRLIKFKESWAELEKFPALRALQSSRPNLFCEFQGDGWKKLGLSWNYCKGCTELEKLNDKFI